MNIYRYGRKLFFKYFRNDLYLLMPEYSPKYLSGPVDKEWEAKKAEITDSFMFPPPRR